MAFDTIRSATGVDFFGTPEIDNLVAFNEPQNVPFGSVFVGAREGDDIIEVQEFTTGVASNFDVNAGKDSDSIIVESALTDSIISADDGSDDIMIYGLAAQTSIAGGVGDDYIYTDSLTNSTVSGLENADIIEFGDGGYYDDSSGVTHSNSTVNGNTGEDIIYLDGIDRVISSKILGGNDNDSILYSMSPSMGFRPSGSNVNGFFDEFLIDFINGTINGNKGNDFIEAYSSRDAGLTIFGGQGGDTIITGEENQPDVREATLLDNGYYYGPDSAATYISGDLGNDSMVGGNDDDTILGGDGNDTGYGGMGDDYMEGNVGSDSMIGGSGDDTLFGGAGNDTLSGKGGVDLIYGRADADTYQGDFFDGSGDFAGDTFFIEAISDSAAAVSGTTRTFDKFVGDSFDDWDDVDSVIDITAVANILAAGSLLNDNVFFGGDYDLGEVSDFTQFQVAVDALNGGTGVDASSINGIVINYFTATVGEGEEARYLQISDANRFYTVSDLLFEVDMDNEIGTGDILTIA